MGKSTTHRIHGAAIYGVPWIPSTKIPFMLAYIPAPWILWAINGHVIIRYYNYSILFQRGHHTDHYFKKKTQMDVGCATSARCGGSTCSKSKLAALVTSGQPMNIPYVFVGGYYTNHT